MGHITLLQTTCLSPQEPFCPFIVLMVTQFAWPCLLSPFWHVFCHSGPLHSPTSGCPCLPAKQTLTVSHFFCQKAESLPSGLMSSISQPVSSLSCPMSQCTCPTSASQVTGNNGGGERVYDKNWSCLVVLTDNWWRRMSWRPSPERWTQEGLNDENYIIKKQTHTHTHIYRNFSLPISDDLWMSSIGDSWEPLLSHSIAQQRVRTSTLS